MELNSVANLYIIASELRKSIETLKSTTHSGTQEVVGNQTVIELAELDAQLKYLHNYLNEIGKVLKENNLSVPYWHEVRAKVDGNELQ